MSRTARRTSRPLRALIALITVAAGVLVLGTVPANAAGPISATPTSIPLGSSHLGVTVVRSGSLKVASGYKIVHLQSYGGEPFGLRDVSAACSAAGPATCSFKVTFTPIATGAATGSVWAVVCPTTGTAACTDFFVPLSGTGVAPGSNSLSTLTFSSTKVQATTTKTFTVKHDKGWFVRYAEFYNQPGTTNAVFAITGTTFGPLLDPCGRSTTATSCVLSTYFRPRAIGAVTDTMTVYLCSVADPTFCTPLPKVKVSGTGLAPAKLSVSSVSFGNVAVSTGSSKPVSITIDPGWHFGGSGTNASPGSTGGDVPFRGTQTCQTVGTSCRFEFQFTPQAAGPFAAQGSASVCNAAQFCIELPRIPLTGTGVLSATKTTLKASPTTVALGQTVTLTATVSPEPSPVTARGTVTFYDGKVVLCAGVPVQVNPELGIATATCSATASGAKGWHSLNAVYSGSAYFKTSTSATVTATYTAS